MYFYLLIFSVVSYQSQEPSAVPAGAASLFNGRSVSGFWFSFTAKLEFLWKTG